MPPLTFARAASGSLLVLSLLVACGCPEGSESIRFYFERFAVRPGMFFEDRRARSAYLWTTGYRWAREDLG